MWVAGLSILLLAGSLWLVEYRARVAAQSAQSRLTGEVLRILLDPTDSERVRAILRERSFPHEDWFPQVFREVINPDATQATRNKWAAASVLIKETNPKLAADFRTYTDSERVARRTRPFRVGALATGVIVTLPVFLNTLIVCGVRVGRVYGDYVRRAAGPSGNG